MTSYDTTIDLLIHDGPGLQDYVTAKELNWLIDGTMPIAEIADRYQAEVDASDITIEADPATDRAALLGWIRYEIEIAIDQRRQEADRDEVAAVLTELATATAAEQRLDDTIHGQKVAIARRALATGATKSAVAHAANISRPTLDKWLTESEA